MIKETIESKMHKWSIIQNLDGYGIQQNHKIRKHTKEALQVDQPPSKSHDIGVKSFCRKHVDGDH